MGVIEDGFDDFLNQCFCKLQNARMKLLTHLFNIALDDCAERAMDDVESGDQQNEELGDERKVKSKKRKEAKSQGGSKSNMVTKGDGELEAGPTSWRKSEYELEKEKKIAENKALLASIYDPESEKTKEELKKDTGGAKRKKPNPQERRASARFHDGTNMWVSVQLAATLILMSICQD